MVNQSKSTAEDLAELFQALGDRTRVRLLNLLLDGEVCVCFFVAVLDEPQPKISRHLAYLRSAGLVSARRDGKWAHYAITPPEEPTLRATFDAVIATMRRDPELQRDRSALANTCCSPELSDQLRRAPRPAIATAATLPES